MEIPAEFVLANPTLCGEAIVEAWKDVQSWSDWFCEHRGYISGNRETPTPCAADEWWAKSLFTRLRELGYRRYHIGVDFAAEGTESKSAPPQMAPDAKPNARCQCEHEFVWEEQGRISVVGWNDVRQCPRCLEAMQGIRARARYAAAHPPAEPAARPLTEAEVATIRSDPLEPFRKPAETPATDEVEGLAKELHDVRWGCAWREWHHVKDQPDWRNVARHCLRRERERAIRELEWATNKSAMTIQNRMAHLQGLRKDGGE